MFERSEFLPLLKSAALFREPEGQGVRAPFSAYSFVVYKRVRRRAGSQPRDLGLLIHIDRNTPPPLPHGEGTILLQTSFIPEQPANPPDQSDPPRQK